MALTIISGGQTGADQAGIAAAIKHGLPVEGWAPKGWLTEYGRMRTFLEGHGLQECQEGQTPAQCYRARTVANVAMSDAVLIIGRKSAGSSLTRNLADGSETPGVWLDWSKQTEWSPTGWRGPSRMDPAKAVIALLRAHKPERLMVAGNRESKNPGIGEAVFDMLDRVFAELQA